MRQGGGTGMHMALCRRRVCDGPAGRRRGRHNQRAILQAHFTAQGAHAVDHGQGIVAKRCGKAVQAGIRRRPRAARSSARCASLLQGGTAALPLRRAG